MSLNNIYPGKIIKLPLVGQATIMGTAGNAIIQTEHEEVYYSYDTMSYRTISQQLEINRLQKELQDKENKRKTDLKSIISYYYKR